LEPLEDRTLLAVSITGTIFNDLNSDMMRESGETPAIGATVFVDANHNGVLDTSNYSLTGPVTFVSTPPAGTLALTDPINLSGFAQISNLKITLNASRTTSGSIGIALVSPAGLSALTGPNLIVVNGTAGSFNGTLDDNAASGVASTITTAVTGTFRPLQQFNDPSQLIYDGPPNPNGGWRLLIFANSGSPALTGFQLNSWSMQFTGTELSTTTDSNGQYAFNDLPAGPVTVAVVNTATGTNPSASVTVPTSGKVTQDIGIHPNPDLVGTSFQVVPSGSVDWGSSVFVNYTITNRGPGDAGPFHAEIRLSNDGTIDTADTLLTPFLVPTDPSGLKAGSSVSGTVMVHLPGSPGVPPSGFDTLDKAFLGLRIDSANEVAETTETNNANQGNGIDMAPVVPFGDLQITNNSGVQQQPSLAVDPTNANHLAMAYMDYAQPGVLAGYAGIAVIQSTNGGVTWTAPTPVPLLAGYDGAAGYPVARFDGNGNFFVSFMAAKFLAPNLPPVIFPDGISRNPTTNVLTRSYGMLADNGIFLARLNAGSASWSTTMVDGRLITGTPVRFDAIPDMAIDTSTTATRGNIYITWTRFYPDNTGNSNPTQGMPSATGTVHTGGSEIMFAVSTNGGVSFTTKLNTTTSLSVLREPLGNTDNFELGAGAQVESQVTVAPNGQIYVSYFYSTGTRFRVQRSSNAGTSFNPEADPFGNSDALTIPSYSTPGFRNLPTRGLVADPANNGRLYAFDAIADTKAGNTTAVLDQANIVVSRSVNANTSTAAVVSGVATISSTWQRYFTVGGSVGNINTVPSSDRSRYRTALNDDDGSRFLRSVDPTTLAANEVTSVQGMPQLVVDSQGDVVVIWYDTRRDPSGQHYDVYGTISTDGGLTYSSNFRLTDVSNSIAAGKFTDPTGKDDFYLGDSLGLAVANGMVYAAWTDTRNGNQNIYFTRFSIQRPPAPLNDHLEPNDSPTSPVDLGMISAQQIFPKLNVAGGDVDFYRITPAASGTLMLTVSATSPLTLQVYDNTGTKLLATGTATVDGNGNLTGQQLRLDVAANVPLLIKVSGPAVGQATVPYSLTALALTADLGTHVTTPAAATVATINGTLAAKATATFQVTAPVTGTAAITMTSGSNVTGNLNLTVLDQTGNIVLAVGQPQNAAGKGEIEIAVLNVTAGQILQLQVMGADTTSQGSFTLVYSSRYLAPNGKALFKLTAPVAGSFEVTLTSGTDVSGNLNLSILDGTGATVLAVGQSNKSGGGPGEIETAMVNVTEGQVIVIQVVGATGTAHGTYTLGFVNRDPFQTAGQTSLFFPTAGSDPTDLAVGPLTGALPDIVTVNPDLTNPISVLRNNGSGLFDAPQTYAGGTGGTLPSNATRSVVVDDFGGDTSDDVAFTNYFSGSVSVLVNNQGNLGADRRSDAILNGSRMASANFNDLDDGELDLIVFPSVPAGSAPPGEVAVLLGHGDGTFVPPKFISIDLTSTTIYGAVGDFNHDGHEDFAVFGRGETDFEVFLGNGDGTFQDPIVGMAAENVRSVAAADLNGDKKDDLVIGGGTSGRVFVMLSNGDGTFAPGLPFSANTDPGQASAAVVGIAITDAGTVDGSGHSVMSLPDGRKDILTVTIPSIGGGSPHVNLLSQLTGPTFGFAPPTRLAGGPFTGAIATGDFDNDGRQDVAIATAGGVQVVYSQALKIPANTTLATARDLGEVVHELTPKEVIAPGDPGGPNFLNSFFKFTVPSEIAQGAGDEVVDISAKYTNQEGAGLDLEVLDTLGHAYPADVTELDDGTRIRLVAPQGTVLILHVFGRTGTSTGAGVYTLDIDVLTQIVSVQAVVPLPGVDGQPGSPTNSLVVTLQGDQLDPAIAEVPTNYLVIWEGPNNHLDLGGGTSTPGGTGDLGGTGGERSPGSGTPTLGSGASDDEIVPLSTAAGMKSVVYNAAANPMASSGRTNPATTLQTLTFIFDTPLQPGSYFVEILNSQTPQFNSDEANRLVDDVHSEFNGHQAVAHFGTDIIPGAAIEGRNIVLTAGPIGDLSVFNQGTTFFTNFHDSMGSAINTEITAHGDTDQVSQLMLAQTLAQLGTAFGIAGEPLTNAIVFILDPVSLDLEDPNNQRATYDLQSARFSNRIANTFFEVGGNVEVILIGGALGTYHLNLSDAQATAQGVAVVFADGVARTTTLTDALRAGRQQFDFTIEAASIEVATRGTFTATENPGADSAIGGQGTALLIGSLLELQINSALIAASITGTLGAPPVPGENDNGWTPQQWEQYRAAVLQALNNGAGDSVMALSPPHQLPYTSLSLAVIRAVLNAQQRQNGGAGLPAPPPPMGPMNDPLPKHEAFNVPPEEEDEPPIESVPAGPIEGVPTEAPAPALTPLVAAAAFAAGMQQEWWRPRPQREASRPTLRSGGAR
jgi:hypothetical protein